MTDSAGGGKGMAIAAMVIGIAAFFPGCCLSAFYLNFVLAVVAIILGVKAMGGPGRGMAMTGLILGVLAIVLYVVGMIAGADLGERMQDWAKEQQATQESEGGEADPSGE